uniref:Histone deacetylase domain-containing protein n=1 Tax=Ditylenchus dipsaci TaxID=166011 RepID=A0A915CUC9_9BILA
MLLHQCEWDDDHIEKPDRLKAILDAVSAKNDLEKSLLDGCKILESTEANLEDIYLVHGAHYVDTIRQTPNMSLQELEEFSSKHDAIYVNNHTWEASLLSAGCSLKIWKIPTPWAPCLFETPCGFCFFNNVAICAKKARVLGVKRVLILDWDVHAGQGTQYCVEGDPGIKLISIHGYQHGDLWPKLPESATVHQYKNTINVPLNDINNGDVEYITILNFLVLPLIADWKPELILVSCGFDAASGDGAHQTLTPGGYSYMTGVLAGLGIPLCLLYEGGYFIESVAQCACFTIEALQDRKTPSFDLNLKTPLPSLLHSLYSTIFITQFMSPIMKTWMNFLNKYRLEKGKDSIVAPQCEYTATKETKTVYQTRGRFKSRNPKSVTELSKQLEQTLQSYKEPANLTGTILIEVHQSGIGLIDTNNQNNFIMPLSSKVQLSAIYFYILLPLSLSHQPTPKPSSSSVDIGQGTLNIALIPPSSLMIFLVQSQEFL